MSQTAANREDEEALEAVVAADAPAVAGADHEPGIVPLPTSDPEPDEPDNDAPPPEAAQLAAEAAAAEATAPNTRDRILDVALDLFTEQGFDATSLRQIAERLGVTKAALYYHFESKDDILMALHMRLHELGRDALARTREEPVTLELWGELLDGIVDQMLAQRQLFLMHQRNQAVLEKLHREDHDAEHEDIEEQFRRLLADTRVPLRDRVRIAASFGVLFSGLFLSGEAFAELDNAELGGLLREVIHDVLRG
jgi:AcrR family transcriptional regulator